MRAVAILVLVLAAGLFAFRPRPPWVRPPSVLLITVDTLRADRLGAYGAALGATPQLDALARRGTLFKTALSSVPLTLPSHATILSGLQPYHHGVHDNGIDVFPADRETLATRLQAQGLATGAFVGAYVLDRRFGLARGFDRYDDAIERRSVGVSELESERRCEVVVASATKWIGQQAGRFFAWVHLYDPHAPYDPPEPWKTRFAGRPYEGEIAATDACVGQLLESVATRDVVVAVVADHGEGLGEHDERSHGFFLYESTLRVPLILAGPAVPPGRTAEWARTVDLAPTLLRLAGADVPSGLDGVDLFGASPARPAYAETLYPASFGWAPLRSLRDGSLKFIAAPRPELYDLAKDAGETRNLHGHSSEAALALEQELGALAASTPREGQAVDPEVEARLRALGYVVAPPVAASSAGARDPKDMVGLWNRFEEANWAAGRGEAEEPIRALRQLVREDPSNETFRRSLTALLRKAGKAADAAELLDLPDSRDALTWHERAVALAGRGDMAGALAAEERAIALNPRLPEPHNHRGALLASGGRLNEALAAFDRALAIDPNNARAWANKGNALRAMRRFAEAGEAFRRAAALAPRDPDPLNGLGVLAVEAEDAEAAVSFFRQALALEPSHAEVSLNLAVAEVQRGRPDLARAELDALIPTLRDPALVSRARGLRQSLH